MLFLLLLSPRFRSLMANHLTIRQTRGATIIILPIPFAGNFTTSSANIYNCFCVDLGLWVTLQKDNDVFCVFRHFFGHCVALDNNFKYFRKEFSNFTFSHSIVMKSKTEVSFVVSGAFAYRKTNYGRHSFVSEHHGDNNPLLRAVDTFEKIGKR